MVRGSPRVFAIELVRLTETPSPFLKSKVGLKVNPVAPFKVMAPLCIPDCEPNTNTLDEFNVDVFIVVVKVVVMLVVFTIFSWLRVGEVEITAGGVAMVLLNESCSSCAWREANPMQ